LLISKTPSYSPDKGSSARIAAARLSQLLTRKASHGTALEFKRHLKHVSCTAMGRFILAGADREFTADTLAGLLRERSTQ
jgi:hypothetical protein